MTSLTQILFKSLCAVLNLTFAKNKRPTEIKPFIDFVMSDKLATGRVATGIPPPTSFPVLFHFLFPPIF